MLQCSSDRIKLPVLALTKYYTGPVTLIYKSKISRECRKRK